NRCWRRAGAATPALIEGCGEAAGFAAATVFGSPMARSGSMERAEVKSFRRVRPRCPDCYSSRTHVDWSSAGNLLRLPGAILSGMVLSPAVGIRMRCSECDGTFVTTRDGAEAGHWEPITERTAELARADSS